MKKIISTLIFFLLATQITNSKAEVVKPTFVQTFSLDGEVRDPSDVDLSPDGTKIFFSEFRNGTTGTRQMRQYTLTTPFDISTLDISSKVGFDLNAGADSIGGGGTNGVQGFSFNNNGTKVFAVSTTDQMNVHTLATPYDFSSVTQDDDDGITWQNHLSPVTAGGAIEMRDIEFNNDGTKMFFVDAWSDDSLITYNLSTPYLPSSATLGPEVDLGGFRGTVIQDFEFDDDGTRLYLIESSTGVAARKFYVYKLSTPFDVSTAKFVGSTPNFFDAENGHSTPLGLGFSKDGMKLYQTTYDQNSTERNAVHEYDLSCPYGIVICEEDTVSNTSAQVDAAKQIIHQNSSVIFKRFDWLRRNEGNENLNSNNINLEIHNPILSALSETLKSNFKQKYTKASLKKTKENTSNYKNLSFWSHGDVSFGRSGDTATTKPKEIRIAGFTVGVDKKLENNKFLGIALRYGQGDTENITGSGNKLSTDSLTLNLYSTLPVNNKSYFNTLLGFSFLKLDQISNSNKVTGERNGNQLFTSINLQNINGYGDFNIRPTGSFEFGLTNFSSYTDFNTSNQDVYDNLSFSTGNVSAGLKFDNLIEREESIFSRHGTIQYVQDLSSDIDYKITNHTNRITETNTVETHSLHNIKANFGFETLFKSGRTFALNYERFQGLDDSSHQHSLFFKFGYLREDKTDFAFSFDPLINNTANLSYLKHYNYFDLKIDSNYSLMDENPDYGLNFQLSNTF